MIPFTQNFRKCKVTYRDKEVGQWQPEEGMGDGGWREAVGRENL